MGRKPCCAKEGLNRGAWTAMEDRMLTEYVKRHGEGKWRNLPIKAGLKRCGKSCRLRWLNYLRPDIKRGNITRDEEDLIIRLHKLLGNRWSLIAGRIPGRTDNEIKNYWNTNIRKKLQSTRPSSPFPYKLTNQPHSHHQTHLSPSPLRHRSALTPTHVVRTKATRCTKVVISQDLQKIHRTNHGNHDNPPEVTDNHNKDTISKTLSHSSPQGVLEPGPTWALDESHSSDLRMDVDMDEQILSKIWGDEFSPFSEVEHNHHHDEHNGGDLMSSPLSNDSFFLQENMQGELETDWVTSFLLSEFDWMGQKIG